MKPWSVLFVIVASLASTGCFVVTHDQALQRGVVTTTTSADLRDAGAQPTVTSEFDNIDTVKAAVAVTNQFAILPKRTAMRDVKAGTLAVIELEPELSRPIGIIYRKRRASGGSVFTPAAQAFADYLIEHAGPSVDLAAQVMNPGEPAMAAAEAK